MPERALKPATPRGARLVAAAALLSLLAACYLLLFPGDGAGVRGPGAHGYSRSAIGHIGLIRLLRDLGEPVLQLRSARDLGGCGLLVLAEPGELRARDDRQVADWLEDVPALVVLPKRRGEADAAQPHWLADTSLVPVDEVETVLTHVARWADAPLPQLVRADAVGGWRSTWSWPPPVLVGPMQLLAAGDGIEPLVRCDEGVLLARVGGLHVLSDPDLIANHGLSRGANATLVVRMMRHLRGPGAIVFDETLHGQVVEPSIWQAAGQFPLVLVPVHLLLLVALALWIAYDRFGAPLPVPATIAAGKQFLIDNVAALLRHGGQLTPSLRRYGRQRVRAAAEALHAPPGLADDQCRAWLLARVRDPARRGRLEQLLARGTSDASPREALATAREIRTLTEELMHAGR